MSAQVKVVQQLYANFGKGDIPAVLSVLTDDIVWHSPGPTEILPWAGTHRGKQQVEQWFTVLGGALEILKFEPQEFISQGDKVVALGYEQARVKSTGRINENNWAMVWTLRDGKIAEFRAYEDTAGWVAASRSK